MTTIREQIWILFPDHGRARAVAFATLSHLDIDPDWPEGSFVVTRRPPCPKCGGTGIYERVPRGIVQDLPCPACEGTGLLPAKWESEQKCLDWLREQGKTPLTIHTPPGGAYTVWRGRLPDDRDPHYGSTLHLALLAACIAA